MGAEHAAMITIDNVRKVYRTGRQEVVALDGVSLEVASGEIYGVIGESGAGKSTLIRCINNLEVPTSGTVRVDGQDITALRGTALRRARQNIGMIFQGFNLLSARTAAENVALQLEVVGTPRGERRQRVDELLDLVGLRDRANARPARLSGGQKQRVGIARALAASPKVLLSDEATSALDPRTTASILDLLKRLNRELGLTILLITHEMEVVKRICDHVAVLEAGRIVEQGRVADLAMHPATRIGTALFPQPAVTPTDPEAYRVTVPFGGDQGLESLLLPLASDFAVRARVVSGSVEQVGDASIGQFHLDLSGDRTAEALAWIRSRYPEAVIQ